jgi:hypothetical protein
MFPTKVVELLIVAKLIAAALLVKVTTFPTKVVDVLTVATLIADALLVKVTTFPDNIVAVLIEDTLELKLTILPEIFAVMYLVAIEFEVCELEDR